MYHSIALVALISAATPAQYPSISWMSNYAQAHQAAVRLDRPLAVFFAPGKDGWNGVVQGGDLGWAACYLIANDYVALHVDTSTAYGKGLAKAFHIPGEVGLVLSDRSRQTQAVRRVSRVTANELASQLRLHGSPPPVPEPSPYTREPYAYDYSRSFSAPVCST